MIKRPITITNKLGLHARASAKLTQTASKFDSSIFIARNGRRVAIDDCGHQRGAKRQEDETPRVQRLRYRWPGVESAYVQALAAPRSPVRQRRAIRVGQRGPPYTRTPLANRFTIQLAVIL